MRHLTSHRLLRYLPPAKDPTGRSRRRRCDVPRGPADRSRSQRDVDFSKVPLHAIFVIHDAGLDWALATQVITELLCSDGGRMGTRRKRQFGVYDGRDLPVVLTNPDFIWGT